MEQLVGRLTLENEFLKKGLQNSLSQSERNGKSSAGGNTSSAISRKGRLMNIARSTFYYRRKNASLGKDADVIDKIEEICLEFPGYG